MNYLQHSRSTQLYKAIDGFKSKSPSVSNLLKLSGGDLGKGSSPGARARSDARKAITNRPKAARSKPGGSGYAEAWSSNPSKRSRPAAANHLAQQFKTGPIEGGNGLFGRFSARPTPPPYNPGCAGGPRSLTVTGLTQNAGSEKKDPSYDYIDIMRELDKQSNQKSITIQVAEQTHNIKNPYGDSAYELSDNLAERIYDSIRECDTDICDIAQNLGFKADNIKNVKDHVFYNEHDLDRYGPDQIEHKRFDATLSQALAWKRLEAGIHTQDDVTWIKHECAERHHELKYDSGYSKAHDRAQSRFDGAPWENNW